MRLAIIPARGGSKRIQRKNIKLFGGQPMIAWSIQAAQEANIFDKIIVSTDDAEIAHVAHQYGAEIPFTRPQKLSGDHIGTIPVVAHAINWYKERNIETTKVCCIYATAPFIRASDIRNAADILDLKQANFTFPVASFPASVQRALVVQEDGFSKMLDPKQFETRSQDLPQAYHDAGQFYWGTPEAWLSGMPIFGSKSFPIILPRHRVQDIDTIEDWDNAEIMHQALKELDNR